MNYKVLNIGYSKSRKLLQGGIDMNGSPGVLSSSDYKRHTRADFSMLVALCYYYYLLDVTWPRK